MKNLSERVREQAVNDLTIARASTFMWRDAVAWLSLEMPDDLKAKLRELIAAEPEMWIVPLHFSWGMAVRNRLRDAGFGEVPFGIQNLDNIYVALVEEAVK